MAKTSHHGDWATALVLLTAAVLAGYSYYALHRPLGPLQPHIASVHLQTTTGTSQLQWPASGQSAVAVVGTNIIATHGQQTSVPTASVAKVITALTVLQTKPLQAGQNGPLITLGPNDVALYNSYVAQDGSVVPVSAGEMISQRQMLEAMMLPSANNIADSLAIWAYGSLGAYQTAANQYLSRLGLHDTHVGSDASGFSASSTSTAHDLVILGQQAMLNPVLRQIVSQTSTNDIPGVASAPNVNFLLGSHNIVGIKTGNTDQAGGVYLSASTTMVNDQSITLVTALLGAPSLFQALQTSLPLITSAQNNFVSATILHQQAAVGEYRLPWGGVIPATAQTNLSTAAWRGTTAGATVHLQPITIDARLGQVVGSAASAPGSLSSDQHTNIILAKAPTLPGPVWRLLHPFN